MIRVTAEAMAEMGEATAETAETAEIMDQSPM